MGPVLFTGKALYWGTQILQFVPWWTQAWRTLQGGELPLWNPLVGMGAPLLANYQSALLYPPTWIYFGLAAIWDVPGIAWGMALLVALHLAWSGLGMALLVRRLGWGELAQTVSGLAFGLSGYLVARSHFLSINSAVAWAPWVLLAAHEVATAERSKLWKLALVVGLQLLAGHAQITWYTLLLAAAWAGFWGFQVGNWAGVRRAAWRFTLAGGWAAALAAAQLLPTAEYLLNSARAGAVDYEFAMTYSFWPWRFLTLFAPNLFGNPAHGDFWGYATYWEDAAYVGLLGILLAMAGILQRGKSQEQRRLAWFAIGIIAVSFLLALGKNTPVFPWLYRNVPTFDMFQAPARWLIWAEVALALLAGLGVEGWRRPEGRGLYWSRLGTMAAFAVMVGAVAGVAAIERSGLSFGKVQPTFVPALAWMGLWGLGAGALNLLASPRGEAQPRREWTWAVSLWLAADLLVAGWGLNPGIDLDVYRRPSTNANVGFFEDARIFYFPEDEQELKFEHFLNFASFEPSRDWHALRDSLLPNVNILDGVASANNFDPLVPERYPRFLEAMETAAPRVQDEMLRLMGVWTVARFDPANPSTVNFERVGQGKVDWRPCSVMVVEGDEALKRVLANIRDYSSGFVVVLEGEVEKGVGDCAMFSPEAGIGIESQVGSTYDKINHFVIRVYGRRSGFMILSDMWYPGWEALIDGESTPVFRADYLFRAVEVPPGEHVVEFVYRPMSFYVGVAVTAVAWAALWWAARRPRSIEKV